MEDLSMDLPQINMSIGYTTKLHHHLHLKNLKNLAIYDFNLGILNKKRNFRL